MLARSAGQAGDSKGSSDRLLFDLGWARAGEVGRLPPAPAQVVGDQRLDDAPVLAVDPDQQAESYRRTQDFVQSSIRGHQALLRER